MEIEKNQVEKLCGFYINDWHFTTMLLPYISSKIDEKVNVVTILEKNIEENIKSLVEKLNLKNKHEILNINWTSINCKKYINVKNLLDTKVLNNKENIILIKGCKNYIEKNNLFIENWLKNHYEISIKIINFYEVTEFNNNILNILDNHNRVLNTSGEREIGDVFDGYKKVMNNN